MTPERDRELSVAHEAGHSFAFAFFGARRVRAWLTPEGGGWTRHENLRDRFNMLVAILAGAEAEQVLCGHTDSRETRDRVNAKKIVAKITADAHERLFVMDAAQRKARALVTRFAAPIRCLAQRLDERGSLSTEEVTEMVQYYRSNAA
jgi:hypothetical protein